MFGIQSLMKKIIPNKMKPIHWLLLAGLVVLLLTQEGYGAGSRKRFLLGGLMVVSFSKRVLFLGGSC